MIPDDQNQTQFRTQLKMDHKVRVVKPAGRNYEIRFIDHDGAAKRITAGSTDEAVVKAKVEEIRAKLLLGQPVLDQRQRKQARPNTGGDTMWPVFVDHYKSNVLCHQSDKTQDSVEPMLDVLVRIIGDRSIRQVARKELVNQLKDQLRKGQGSRSKKPRRTATVNAYLRTLRQLLMYAHHELGWLESKPRVTLLKEDRKNSAKGRPVTADEVEQMVAAAHHICQYNPEEYELLIRGIYYSGLRLDEAMHLTFDDPSQIYLKSTDGSLVIVFPAEMQKNKTEEETATIPDFRQLVKSMTRTTGFVFRPSKQDGRRGRPTTQVVGRRLTDIGRAAGITVNQQGGYAGAHSLR